MSKVVSDYTNWLENNGKSKGSISVYLISVKKLIEWFEVNEEKEFDAARITKLNLHDFFQQLKGEMGPATLNKTVSGIKSFFNFILETGITKFNPMVELKFTRSKLQKSTREMLTLREKIEFLEVICETRNEWLRYRNLAICQLISEVGLRVNEIANLLIDDVILIEKIIVVRGSKVGKDRTFPLNEDAVEALKSWLLVRNTIFADTSKVVASPFLFIAERGRTQGEKLSVRSIHHMVTAYAKSVGLDINPDMLRCALK